jgi:3-methyladenine DNA glycosylase Tag
MAGASSSELYKKYHDQEWGTPVYDDVMNFITGNLSSRLELDYYQ